MRDSSLWDFAWINFNLGVQPCTFSVVFIPTDACVLYVILSMGVDVTEKTGPCQWLTSHVDARETLMSWRAQEFLKLVEIDFYICWEINLKAFWLNLPTTVKIKFFFNFYKVRLRTYVFTSVKCILTTICSIVLENDKTVLTFHCHSVYLFIFITLLRS